MLIFDRRLRKYFWPGLAVISLLFLFHYLFQRPGSTKSTTKKMTASLVIPAREKGDAVDSSVAVPRIIHQTWKSFHVPEVMGPWVKSWVEKNPDWEYWFWTDDDMEQLVKERFPRYYAFYMSYPDQAYRIDAFRYFVLVEYGGAYVDLDMEAVKPLNTVISQTGCMLSQEPLEHAHFLSPMGVPLVSNALMACRPRHPFFLHVIGDLKTYSGFFEWNDVLKATGPYMLTEIYKGYSRNGLIYSAPTGDDMVQLADPETFQPTTDFSMQDHMQQVCQHSAGHDFLSGTYLKWQEKLCTNIRKNGFRGGPTEDSISVHHWTHTWAGKRSDPWNIQNNPTTFDVRSLKDRGI